MQAGNNSNVTGTPAGATIRRKHQAKRLSSFVAPHLAHCGTFPLAPFCRRVGAGH